MKDFLFTSESVTEGHPDKIADQISDGILDALLEGDKNSRVACETLVTTGLVLVGGEITSRTCINYPDIIREIIKEIGYDDAKMGFDYKTCAVMVTLDRQSPDIAIGVDKNSGKEQGAGDQGLMFGYACNHTPELMPLPISLAHKITRRMAEVRKSGKCDFIRPDGKSQVTARYENNKPVTVDAVVISTQHAPDVDNSTIREFVIEEIAKEVIQEKYLSSNTKFYINPTGRFVIGGPQGDCGLTGRKIIVDTYGGHGSHGGGAFSGKDPSKVDRSASYMARYIAKNIIAAGLAEECEVQLAYAIGIAEPVSVMVDTFGTAKIDPYKISRAVKDVFPLKPEQIIKRLDLLRPIYKKTATYGHFGRSEPEFTWERTDMVDVLKDAVGL